MSTDAYLDAKTAFERANSTIVETARLLSGVGQRLASQPERFIFSNLELGLPPEASLSRDSMTVNADHWKSAQQIQEMLADWHKRKEAMLAAWRSVPQERKAGLVPPAGVAR